MARLVLLRKDTRQILNEQIFETEEKLEDFISANPEVLGGITILKRQPTNRTDRPDLIGIDKEGNIAIIEIKDEQVTDEIVSQVFDYADWAEQSPDSMKALWLELKDKPEGVKPDWDNIHVRIILVAPDFKQSVARKINKIGYNTSLIQVKRFTDKNDQLIFINEIKQEEVVKPFAVRGKGDYTNPECLKDGRNPKSVEVYLAIARKIEKLTKIERWPLDVKYNKWYLSVKYNGSIAYGIEFETTKTLDIFFRNIPALLAKRFKSKGIEYDSESGTAWIYVEDKNFEVNKLKPLFEASYKNTAGK